MMGQMRWSDWSQRWLRTFVLIWLSFPCLLLALHQLVLHSWVAEQGFMDHWSLSVNVLMGDSLLSAAAATVVTLRWQANQMNVRLWPEWMKQRRGAMAVWLGCAPVTYIWVMMINGRQPNWEVSHNYAWVYDRPHWLIGTTVMTLMVYGLAAVPVLLTGRQLQQGRLVSLVLVCLVAGYLAVVAMNKPAIRIETGWQVGSSHLEWLQHKLFTWSTQQQFSEHFDLPSDGLGQ